LFIIFHRRRERGERMKHQHDRLFQRQNEIIPFYFAFSPGNKSARQTAIRFLQTFLLQTVAFRRQDARLLSIAPDVCEISDLAAPADAHWVYQLIKTCKSESELADEASFIRAALSAPLRAAANDAQVFVMLDDLHFAEDSSGEIDLFAELKEICSRGQAPFVFAGRRRFLSNAAQGGNGKLASQSTMRLGELSGDCANDLIEKLAARYEIKINEQTRDLIVRQFRGNPFFITEIFDAARAGGVDLDNYYQVEKATTDALFGGGFGRYYDGLFAQIAPNLATQKQIVRLLRETAASEKRRTPLEVWRRRLNLQDEEVYRIIGRLHVSEIACFGAGHVESANEDENPLLSDYIEARYRLEVLNGQRALVVGEILARALKRAPQLMTRYYRRAASLNLKELLAAFNCQPTPAILLDYARFAEKYKGAEMTEIRDGLDAEIDKIILPQIVYAANTVAFYPPIARFVDTAERSAVAFGFEAADYRHENEIVWIAAQIDSKLEAARDLTEFWCDRLEMVAVMCNFTRYRLWLIAPEGFSAEATEVLRGRGAYASSRRQAELFAAHLNAENVIGKKTGAEAEDEYEIIVPMGEDAELLAAHAVEDIARRHSFKPAAINQMKTALVEACINAAEHSLSPDRKIYQKFKIEGDKIIITISNRGLKIPPEKIKETVSNEPSREEQGRRGWGLKLMRQLMDEVRFEQTDDGTRITMVKYRSEENREIGKLGN
jgi:serine/threonine-protein kinase RsbW